MAKDPAILLYTSDFLTGTMFMSDDQVGKYIKLLCAQHQKGRLTLDQMLKICLTEDSEIFDKFKQDEDGLYYNERIEVEISKRRKYNPYKIASATLGGLISSGNYSNKKVKFIRKNFKIDDYLELKSNEEIKTSVKLWLSKCLTIYEDEIENKDEDEVKDEKEIVYPFDSKEFLDAWKLWKEFKKEQFKFIYQIIGEQSALINISKLAKLDCDTAIRIINQSIQNGWKGLFELKTNNGQRNNNTTKELLSEMESIIKRAV